MANGTSTVGTIDRIEEVFDLERIHERLRQRRTLLQARQRRLHARVKREAELLAFEQAVRESGGRLPLGDLDLRVIRLRHRVSDAARSVGRERDDAHLRVVA